ncbi:MAG: DUF3276 family protein [Candidatus Margulisiibacteriota bacterium]
MTKNGKSGKELFNRMVKAGQRTYFVNVKEATNGNKYLTITESKLVEKDKFERFRIMIFQDKLGEFVEAVQEAQLIAA